MCQGLGPKKHDEISEIDCMIGTGLMGTYYNGYLVLQGDTVQNCTINLNTS